MPVRKARILTLALPSAFATLASVPGRFSNNTVSCLTLGIALLLGGHECEYRPPRGQAAAHSQERIGVMAAGPQPQHNLIPRSRSKSHSHLTNPSLLEVGPLNVHENESQTRRCPRG